jgi:hypothetical protein
VVDRTGKPKPLSEILPKIHKELQEKSKNADFTVVEDNAEWFILRNNKTRELDISHKRSLTYSRVTPRSGPFAILIYWTENDQRCYEPNWLKVHTEKVFALLK